jgi:hypothetical protein
MSEMAMWGWNWLQGGGFFVGGSATGGDQAAPELKELLVG